MRDVAETHLIAQLGRGGDGVADTAEGPLYVPFALPGERVLVERDGRRGRVLSRETDAPERVAPFCPYFETCGGCVAQHMAPALYSDWKRGILAGALAAARLPVEPEGLVDAHGAGRRRITLHARVQEGRVRVGFMMARSHDLVEILACPVAEPGLATAVEAARRLAVRLRLAAKPLDIQVTAGEAGLDIDIRGHGPPDPVARQALVREADALDLARLSIHGETLIERRAPRVGMGRAVVVPPPGGFLQATRAGEEALAALVLDGVGRPRRAADLFCGSGPFALRLAQRCEVHAVEQDAAALAALDRAARAASGLRRVTTEARDLQRRPLLVPEWARFEAVILDPPRAGAEAQCRQLAAASVPRLVMVSCDPGTFARDAAILVAGGYEAERVVPVDQFKYSAHLEIVGIFARPVRRRSRR